MCSCLSPQVYQYMHETITVNGCPEYQARATAKVRAASELLLLEECAACDECKL